MTGKTNKAELLKLQGLQYGMRHLQPENISSLKDQLRTQLKNLRGVNARGTLLPPCIHRPGSRYLSSILVARKPE